MSNSNKKRVTSYDVAREAGVSQSAVSRVFRPGLSVSKKTREKVMETAKRMGYKPNAIARMLITQSSGMVAVMVSTTANVNYPEVLSLLSLRLAEKNKRVLLFTLDDADGLGNILDQLWTYQVDGVIALAAHFDHSSVAQFEQHHIPVVLYNREADDHSVSTVRVNHEVGIKQLVDLLVDKGHRDIAIISGPAVSDVANERRIIAKQALAQHDISPVDIVYGDYNYASGQQAFDQLMALKKPFTAIISGNDNMAIGAIDRAATKYDLLVGKDFSIVGFDGISSANYNAYQLTTIKQPTNLMTEAAVEILLKQIEYQDCPAESRVWSGTLVPGETVGKVQK